MKASEIVKRIRKTKNNVHHYCEDDLANSFGIHDSIPWEQCHTRLKGYWLYSWTCTDTTVGTSLLFLDDEFVGYTQQMARKSDVRYVWESAEAARNVRKFLYDLVEDDEDCFDIWDPEQDIPEYFTVDYTGQRHDYDTATYDGNPFNITKMYHYGYYWTKQELADLASRYATEEEVEENDFHPFPHNYVQIEQDGIRTIVAVRDLQFPIEIE